MKNTQQERRKSRRRAILDTFSVFASVPKKGPHRLTVHDVSDQGIGLDYDTEGESAADSPLKKGEKLEIHFYLNQSLYLPLTAEVARIEEAKGVRRIGAELKDHATAGNKAFLAFLQLVDAIGEIG